MEELGPGLYEALVTEGLKAQLDSLAERLPSRVRDLRAAEAPDRIAWHLSKQIESALADVGDAERVGVGLSVARALLDRLGELVGLLKVTQPKLRTRFYEEVGLTATFDPTTRSVEASADLGVRKVRVGGGLELMPVA